MIPYFKSDQLTIYNADARELLPCLELKEMFCFTAPPDGHAIPLLKKCAGMVVYCASPEIFAANFYGLRQIVALHLDHVRATPLGVNTFTNLLTTCTEGRDVWYNVPCHFMEAQGEPGEAFAAFAINMFCHSKTVIDPYAGQGGTIRAALKMGLHAVAIDTDRTMCEKLKSLCLT